MTGRPTFYLTAPAPCPYLPGRSEQKVFTRIGQGSALMSPRTQPLFDLLSQEGFRRSGDIAYRQHCVGCQACVPTRVLVEEMSPTRSMRRVLARNNDVVGKTMKPQTSDEQFDLFGRYLQVRHADGDMSSMGREEYADMVESSPVQTRLVEYRLGQELIAVALTDVLTDGVSLVYSFFDPDRRARSLGTQVILDHVERVRTRGLAHLYLGFWVEGSPTMDYKARFGPQEHLTAQGWVRAGMPPAQRT